MTATAPPTVEPRKPQQDSLVKKAWVTQERLEARLSQIGRGRYGRVLRMARKPTPEEFRKTTLVAGLGIIVIGAVGFLIYLIFTFIPQR